MLGVDSPQLHFNPHSHCLYYICVMLHSPEWNRQRSQAFIHSLLGNRKEEALFFTENVSTIGCLFLKRDGWLFQLDSPCALMPSKIAMWNAPLAPTAGIQKNVCVWVCVCVPMSVLSIWLQMWRWMLFWKSDIIPKPEAWQKQTDSICGWNHLISLEAINSWTRLLMFVILIGKWAICKQSGAFWHNPTYSAVAWFAFRSPNCSNTCTIQNNVVVKLFRIKQYVLSLVTLHKK